MEKSPARWNLSRGELTDTVGQTHGTPLSSLRILEGQQDFRARGMPQRDREDLGVHRVIGPILDNEFKGSHCVFKWRWALDLQLAQS